MTTLLAIMEGATEPFKGCLSEEHQAQRGIGEQRQRHGPAAWKSSLDWSSQQLGLWGRGFQTVKTPGEYNDWKSSNGCVRF